MFDYLNRLVMESFMADGRGYGLVLGIAFFACLITMLYVWRELGRQDVGFTYFLGVVVVLLAGISYLKIDFAFVVVVTLALLGIAALALMAKLVVTVRSWRRFAISRLELVVSLAGHTALLLAAVSTSLVLLNPYATGWWGSTAAATLRNAFVVVQLGLWLVAALFTLLAPVWMLQGRRYARR